ncbi:N-6 DNA methylase [Corynebacterium phocae]|uniref:N-6 DNA methylase n=1 Tax=Corynebacterium phocae TaxID=161895 RepID=UPI002481ECB9|nr:N-6 DNA methylase [Corynebacterium phocae]
MFTGGPESGADSIRNYLITEDLIDAIIALPKDMFYNTGIQTYIWVLDKNKEPHRRGYIQLIDATEVYEPMRKSMGKKRRELSQKNIEFVAKLYEAFEENDHSKIVTADELGFVDIPMFRPSRLRVKVNADTVAAALNHVSAATRSQWEPILFDADSLSYNDLTPYLKREARAAGLKLQAGLLKNLLVELSVEDPDAEIALDAKGKVMLDKDSKVVERIPLTEDIEEHIQREVLPYAPDMVWNLKDAKTGYEIPMTRLFYKPELTETVEELDAQAAELLAAIESQFKEIRHED